jgi:subtilisin family serine protease
LARQCGSVVAEHAALRDIGGVVEVEVAVAAAGVVGGVVVVGAAGVDVEHDEGSGAYPWLQQDSEVQNLHLDPVVHGPSVTPTACVRSGVTAVWNH